MRIWVTGSSGDLGKDLVKQLESNGHEVFSEPRIDVTQFMEVRAAFQARLNKFGSPDAFFHCAVYVELAKTESDPARTALVNELGSLNVLQTLKELNLKPWFCLVSTGHSYKPIEKPELLNEDSVVLPRSAYAMSKLNSERWAELMCKASNTPLFIPRIFSFTAPWQRPSFVVPRIAQNFKTAMSNSILQMGWLGAYRDFLDIRDVNRALILALDKKLNGTFNIASGKPRKISEICQFFLEKRKSNGLGTVEIISGLPRSDDVEWLIGDSSKFFSLTGFQPSITWGQTLTDIWESVDLKN